LIGEWEVEEAELEADHAAAVQRGKQQLANEPEAQTVRYDQTTDRLIIVLKNGVIIEIPRLLVQGLATAAPLELNQAQLGPRGASIHWEELQVDLSVAGLLTGVFGTRAWMAELGRRGGHVTSIAKANAARQNGKKGGRPAQPMPQQVERIG
jgi:hypothetical protein